MRPIAIDVVVCSASPSVAASVKLILHCVPEPPFLEQVGLSAVAN